MAEDWARPPDRIKIAPGHTAWSGEVQDTTPLPQGDGPAGGF